MKTKEFSPIKLDTEPEKMTTLKKVGIALAGLGLAGAGVLGAKVTGGENAPAEPKLEPVATASTTPGEKTSSTPSPETSAPTAEPTESSESSSHESSDDDAKIEKSIEKLSTKATSEQINWVLEHPVRADEYVTAEDQIEAISLRRNVIINSGETDPDEFSEMVETIYDKTSPGYDGMIAEMGYLTKTTTELLESGKTIWSPISPVEFSGVVEGDTSTVHTIVDRISPSDPSYSEGPALRIIFTMKAGPDGVVRITDFVSKD